MAQERIRQRIRIPPPRRTLPRYSSNTSPPKRPGFPSTPPGYLMINCFWVSGQYKGMRTRQGAVAIRHRRCPVAGKSRIGHRSGYIQIPFHERHQMASAPGFPDGGKTPQRFQPAGSETDVRCARALFQGLHEKWECEEKNGLVVYFTNRCPYTEYHVLGSLADVAQSKGIPLKIIKLETLEQAQAAPHPGHHIHAFPQRAVCHHRPQRMS